MSKTLDNYPQSDAGGAPLAMVVRAAETGARLACETVSHADLSDVFSEAWRDSCLRKGHPHTALADVTIRLLPRLKPGSDRQCEGFDLEVSVPKGQNLRRPFTFRSLSHVGQRIAQRLVAAGTLAPTQLYTYELVLGSRSQAAQPASHASFLQTTLRTNPLTCLQVPLRTLLDQSTAADMVEDDVVPIFYTRAALSVAEKLARKGADTVPPVETGGVLVGSLCSCPESGEFFAVVTEVLEVLDAEQKEFALAYTGRSWMRVQAIMRARQAAHPGHCIRILGQCHGHNFLPNEGKICEGCLQRPTCGLTNLFASLDDQQWSRAVFARQPWQLCHIFGLAARGDRLNALFTLLDGRLQPRGFFTLPSFHPEHWKPRSTQKESSHA